MSWQRRRHGYRARRQEVEMEFLAEVERIRPPPAKGGLYSTARQPAFDLRARLSPGQAGSPAIAARARRSTSRIRSVSVRCWFGMSGFKVASNSAATCARSSAPRLRASPRTRSTLLAIARYTTPRYRAARAAGQGQAAGRGAPLAQSVSPRTSSPVVREAECGDPSLLLCGVQGVPRPGALPAPSAPLRPPALSTCNSLYIV